VRYPQYGGPTIALLKEVGSSRCVSATSSEPGTPGEKPPPNPGLAPSYLVLGTIALRERPLGPFQKQKGEEMLFSLLLFYFVVKEIYGCFGSR